MSLLDSALRTAAKGYSVFPCGPDKAPRVAGGFKAAATNETQIRSWEMLWESDGAMIGAAIPEGIIVVDIDPRNGGDETMALFPRTDPTVRVRTRSGGTHLYYTVAADLTFRAQLGPGVDIKRPGKGYVIVPPSPGYTFVVGGAPKPAPQWLLEELAVEERERSGEAHDPKFAAFQTGTPYGQAALDKNLGRLIQAKPGERNDALNKAAFSLGQLVAGGELQADYAEDALWTAAESIGLEKDEIIKTIESGWTAGEQDPWQAPERGNTQPEASPASVWQPARPTPVIDEANFWVDWDIDEPELPFYLHPVIPKHAYVLVYGATEASKSMSMVGLLCEGSHKGVRSSVYSLENPPATDRQRIRRWRPLRENFRLTNQHLDCSDQRQVEALIERERTWGTDVILIDTYSHAFHSYSDDGNAKAIAFAQVVRYVMQEVGCSVIVVDHTGYMQADEPRDASAKRQQVDVAILMKKAGEWRPGQPARFTMENKKAARFANPFFLTGEIRDEVVGDFKALALGWQGTRPGWPV